MNDRAAIARAAGRSDLIGGISKEGVIREEIIRCERRLVILRQDLRRLVRSEEAQLPLDDLPTFAPEWPTQRAPIDRGQ